MTDERQLHQTADIVDLAGIFDLEAAEELLQYLSPQSECWQPDPSVWIFRGQASMEWELKARAHRGKHEFNGFGLEDELNTPGVSDEIRCQIAEVELLRRFRSALDEAGLPIPSESAAIDGRSVEIRYPNEPPESAIPLLALAQHHGIPTSLLDWSRHSYKAAYFAAVDAAAAVAKDGRLAIWALRTDIFSRNVHPLGAKLRLLVAPAASNPNLNAQAGLFTQVRGGETRSVDDCARRLYVETNGLSGAVPVPWMRRITLPRDSAPRLLRLLSYFSIGGASMFPGYDGVVRRLREDGLDA
jgi:hypothetical protein